MSKDEKILENPTVQRVRAARKSLMKAHDYDLQKLGQALMERQKTSGRQYSEPRRASKPRG